MGRRWPVEETASSLRMGLKKGSEGGVVESETYDRHLMVPELFRGPAVEGGWAPENGSTSSFFSIRSGPGGVLRGGSGVPSDGFRADILSDIIFFEGLRITIPRFTNRGTRFRIPERGSRLGFPLRAGPKSSRATRK